MRWRRSSKPTGLIRRRVSRWTWLLGAGVSYLMMGRDEEAVPWLERSIAIHAGIRASALPAAAAYQRLAGRTRRKRP